MADKNNSVIALMASKVDDLIYGNEPVAEHVIKKILDHFLVGKEESGAFIFCGEEGTQLDDVRIRVIVRDNTEKIKPASYDNTRKLISKCTDEDTSQMRSLCRRWPGLLAMRGQTSRKSFPDSRR